MFQNGMESARAKKSKENDARVVTHEKKKRTRTKKKKSASVRAAPKMGKVIIYLIFGCSLSKNQVIVH
jgi:hypothetical protein